MFVGVSPVWGLVDNNSWWGASEHLLDGTAPSFFADAINGRYMLNGLACSAADIFALSSAAGKTYIDAGGVLRIAGLNELRFNSFGGIMELMIEGDTTNQLQRSEEIGNAYWAKTAVTPNDDVAIAPDLTLTADNIVEDTSASTHGFNRVNILSVSSGQVWCASIFAKPNGRQRLRLQFGHIGRAYRCLFDLTGAGDVVGSDAATGYIERLANGWYRCEVVASISGGTLPSNIFFEAQLADLTNTVTSVSYTGDGVSGMLLWGTQLEQLTSVSARASSYVKAVSAAATRTADICPFTSAANAIIGGASGAVAVRGLWPVRNASIMIARSSSGVRILGPSSSATQAQTQPNDLTVNAGTGDWNTGAGACLSWGASGRHLAMGGGTLGADANLIATGTGTHLGNSTGIPAGQVFRVRQVVGWAVSDRASGAAVQAQARVA